MTPAQVATMSRIQRKLDAWELEHLRELCAEQAERIERLERELADADRAAEFWQDAHRGLSDHLDDQHAIGLTMDGQLLVVEKETGAPAA
jgi:hypothetical protein